MVLQIDAKNGKVKNDSFFPLLFPYTRCLFSAENLL